MSRASFVSAVDTRTIPRAAKPPAQCEWVFSLNNASSNRILFAPEPEPQSGQSPLEAVKMWINCIRLAEWEYSRLNNIFTGTLLGLRGETAQRSPLVKGRFEDWIQVRIPGENEWRRAYLVVSDGTAPAKSKRRLSSFMTLSSSQQSNLAEASASGPSAALYASKRSKKPFITYHKITTAQAVFPESEKLIQTTPIARMEGLMDWDDSDFPEVPDGLNLRAVEETYKLACGKAEDHGVCIFMPDGEAATQDRQGSMLKCVLALTDAFEVSAEMIPQKRLLNV